MNSASKIWAVILQELYITRKSLEIAMDVLVYPIITTIVFGFISLYLAGQNDGASYGILLGMILWQFIWIPQYSITVGALWNIWSHNLANMFIAPLAVWEYMVALVISGVLKSVVLFVIIGLMSVWVFDFNVFSLGAVNLTLLSLNLILFAVSAGWILLGLIFRFGTRIQAIAWGVSALFQPLTAAFFPVSILPKPVQYVAYTLSPTYVFENAREVAAGGHVTFISFVLPFGLNLLYFTAGTIIFLLLFKKSRVTGQFARNET